MTEPIQISVNTADLRLLVQEGKDIVFTADAEKALLQLLELEALIAKAKANAKAMIEETALAYNPNFTSVQGDKVKVGYRVFGSKYLIDDANIDQLPAKFYKTRVTHSPDAKMIDDYLKNQKALPLGIRDAERAKQITIKTIEDFGGGG